MGWTIKFAESSLKQLKKLDKQVVKRILDYLSMRVIETNNPRHFGKALAHDKSGLWRYRVGDYRVICQIRDYELVIVVLELGHRKNIYD